MSENVKEKEKFDPIKYSIQYQKEHYDMLRAQYPKEKAYKERIKAVAEREGITVTQFIINAIEKELEWYE